MMPTPWSTNASVAEPGAADGQVIDAFCEALWLEDGLSRNTLEAYRRDLSLYSQWLQRQTGDGRQGDGRQGGGREGSREAAAAEGLALAAAGPQELQRYIAERHPDSKATSANRRLAVFRRFYRWLVRERRRE